jgi:ADP-ribose pyrophosphatase
MFGHETAFKYRRGPLGAQLRARVAELSETLSEDSKISKIGRSVMISAENGETMAKRKAQKARILRSKTIYSGLVFGIRRDELVEPGGVRTTREVIAHSGSVVVLPVLPDGRVLLIRQYRHAARQFLWELVAGRIDEGESTRKAAARELVEETGYRAKRFRVFLDFFPSPGFLEEKMFILLAEGLTEGIAQPEEDEKIESRAYDRKELEQMIQKRIIKDCKTIAGLLYYFRFLSWKD